MKIYEISSRKILGSSGNWTIESTIRLEDGSIGVSSVAGGISKGEREVVAIDANEAISVIKEIEKELKGIDYKKLSEFDEKLLELDGTENKSKLGGNTMLSLSMAFTKAMAKHLKLETYEYIHTQFNPEIPLTESSFVMPLMMVLILEGGEHGDGSASIQEFMAIVEKIERGVEIYNNVKLELHKLGKSTNVGAEGAFSPQGLDNDQVLFILSKYLHNEKIALDIAASSKVFKEGRGLPNYEKMLEIYPIESIEDPHDENDWVSWKLFSQKYGDRFSVVTDDLTTTNPQTLRRAINEEVGNAIIIKPNQIGTISETLKVVSMAQEANWKIIVSHRGTDTNDDFVSDLAVGVQAEFVKFGAPARGERVAKYNRLLEIFKLLA